MPREDPVTNATCAANSLVSTIATSPFLDRHQPSAAGRPSPPKRFSYVQCALYTKGDFDPSMRIPKPLILPPEVGPAPE